jgi:TATA-box binding protein (TBP) (component of TFIID and TFIIIB)
MRIVNRVLTCSFAQPLCLQECKRRAEAFGLSTTLYTYRPQMLCIRYQDQLGRCSLIIFRSGKARYMGKSDSALNHLLHLENQIVPTQRITPLRESTRTVRIQLNEATPACFPPRVKELPKGCLYEPELFPAIQFQQWHPVCVNLFHTGVAMVLGHTTDAQLADIQTALQNFVQLNK